MATRQSPRLLRVNMPFVDRPSSISFCSSKLTAKYVAEDFQIRQIANKVFDKYLLNRVIIERVAKKECLFIYIMSSATNVIIGENDSKIKLFKTQIQKLLSNQYSDIQIGLLNTPTPEADIYVILNSIVQAIEISNGKNYKGVIRNLLNNIDKTGSNPNVPMGIEIIISGRINGATIASRQKFRAGVISAQTFANDVLYEEKEAMTAVCAMGVKVRILRPSINRKLDSSSLNSANTEKRPSRFANNRAPRTGFNNRNSSNSDYRPRNNYNNNRKGGNS